MIGDEVTVMLFASTDTTAAALTYLLFELARHPDWYVRVRAEVQAAAAAAAATPRTAGPTGAAATTAFGTEGSGDSPGEKQQRQLEELPPFASLNTLPVLNAVLWETLRFYPPAAGTLMRVVPRGGVHMADAGCWLPAGTGTSVQVYTLQRNADAFPQPDMWQPARWLATANAPTVPLLASVLSSSSSSSPSSSSSSSPSPLSSASTAMPCAGEAGAKGSIADIGDELVCYESEAMRQHMLVFSKGARSCLGKAIALMELKLATAAVAQRFATLRLGDERQTVEDMRPVDNVVVTPKGDRCQLVFG
jgi:cytochrome P450